MKLYLVRHGDSSANGSDDERPLSSKGVSDIKNLANFLKPLHLKVARLLTSKKLRAKQTADILTTSIKTDDREIHEDLDPMASLDAILEEINTAEQDLMLVGHLPFVAKLAGFLVSGKYGSHIFSFEAGTMVCLEKVTSSEWTVCWMLTPNLFRSL